jgi:hypothetical protein
VALHSNGYFVSRELYIYYELIQRQNLRS